MRIFKILLSAALIGIFLFGCDDQNVVAEPSVELPIQVVNVFPKPIPTEIPTDRKVILQNLKAKIEAKTPLVVHVFVPLCDNENQGIVPVNASLGNGQNPRTNLYWGAGYGIRTHFQRQKRMANFAA